MNGVLLSTDMELRDLVNSLLEVDDNKKTRGSGRTHRMLVRMANKVISSEDDGKLYAYTTHSRHLSAMCQDMFVTIIRDRLEGYSDEDTWLVSVRGDKVFIGSRTVYFVTNASNELHTLNFTGIYEDHYAFALRLTNFMNSNP